MLSVRPPTSTECPTCFSTRLSRHAPTCSYTAAPSNRSTTRTASSLPAARTRRDAAFLAPPSGMGVLSVIPHEKTRAKDRRRPDQEDHAGPDGCRHRDRRENDYSAKRYHHVSRTSVRSDPKGTVR